MSSMESNMLEQNGIKVLKISVSGFVFFLKWISNRHLFCDLAGSSLSDLLIRFT